MRALIIGGVVAVAVGLVAAPLLTTRSAARTDGMPDGGASTGSGSDGGLAAPAPLARAPMQRLDVRSTDGGPEIVYVGDHIGTLRDAPRALDAGTAPSGPSLAELQAQIAALQARVALAEERQSAAQQQTQLLQQMNDQLRDLNAQMGQVQSQRAAQDDQADAQRQQMQQAINGLGPALDMLASGNGDIGSALDAADQSFPPQARRDLAAARAAIDSSNLGEARALVLTAINDAQAGR